jgi:hypothetical protein
MINIHGVKLSKRSELVDDEGKAKEMIWAPDAEIIFPGIE